MVHRPLGKTGLAVAPIGFGAFKIGRNQKIKYAQEYALPDEEAAARLLNAVLDLGINYIDTAPAYGQSEERIGRALAGRRSAYVLSTKVGEIFAAGVSRYDFSAAAVCSSVEASLRRLRCEYVDLLYLHAPAADLAVLQQTDVVATLHGLRARGLARFIGWSGQTPAATEAALAWADVVMVEYHSEDRRHAAVLDQARRANVGVVVKKALASGRLPPAQAIPFALAHPAVHTIVVGTLSEEHMRTNLQLARQVLAAQRTGGGDE